MEEHDFDLLFSGENREEHDILEDARDLHDLFDDRYTDGGIMLDFPKECMIYNSNNIEIFKNIYGSVLIDEYMQAGKLPLINGINKYIRENNLKYFEFDPKSYKHLDNCRLIQ